MLMSILIGALATSPAAAAETTANRHVYARVEISAEGRIEHVKFRNRMAGEMEAALRKRVTSWSFDPAMKNGQPVRSATTLQMIVGLKATDTGGVQLRIESVVNGPEPLRIIVPAYSTEQVLQGIAGSVVVRCRVNPKGRCVDGRVASTNAQPVLSRSALDAMAAWRFEPESVDGSAIETWVSVPFCFHSSADKNVNCTAAERASVAVAESPLRLHWDAANNL